MPEFKVHNLWPLPVYESEIPVKQEWKDAVVNLEYVRTQINNSDISKDRFVLNNMSQLKTEIETVGPATQLEKIRHGLKFFELRLSNYFN